MKKIMFAAAMLFAGFAQAQVIEVLGKDGEVLPDNYVYTTNSLEFQNSEDGGYFPIFVNNTTNEDIYVKLRITGLENASGNEDMVNFCFGTLCYTEVAMGSTVPEELSDAKITAGSHNPAGDKFTNAYAGDTPGEDVKYHMQFVQFAADGTEIGPLFNFSFVYSTTAGTNDFESLKNMGITIKNTVVNNVLELESSLTADLKLYDINGKLVKGASVAEGVQSVDLSSLSAAVYIAKFTTAENKTAQIRIVKN